LGTGNAGYQMAMQEVTGRFYLHLAHYDGGRYVPLTSGAPGYCGFLLLEAEVTVVAEAAFGPRPVPPIDQPDVGPVQSK
jgi:hypothetical protein